MTVLSAHPQEAAFIHRKRCVFDPEIGRASEIRQRAFYDDMSRRAPIRVLGGREGPWRFEQGICPPSLGL